MPKIHNNEGAEVVYITQQESVIHKIKGTVNKQKMTYSSPSQIQILNIYEDHQLAMVKLSHAYPG